MKLAFACSASPALIFLSIVLFMPKIKVERVRRRLHPYDADMQVDKEAEEKAVEEEDDEETLSLLTGKGRGAILQRHKREWKDLRVKLQKLKMQRVKVKGKDPSAKAEKKDLTIQLKELEDDLRERHRAELLAFDQNEKAQEVVQQAPASTAIPPETVGGFKYKQFQTKKTKQRK
eukprot:c9145_g1_i1.p1 GENE.c9145_g1_i1~~c9145_g1_i1.p1  ORF type:complete len:175 (+),score=37.68 c9145_g1_i1:464-988(+)